MSQLCLLLTVSLGIGCCVSCASFGSFVLVVDCVFGCKMLCVLGWFWLSYARCLLCLRVKDAVCLGRVLTQLCLLLTVSSGIGCCVSRAGFRKVVLAVDCVLGYRMLRVLGWFQQSCACCSLYFWV